jgi:hypothetical protein
MRQQSLLLIAPLLLPLLRSPIEDRLSRVPKIAMIGAIAVRAFAVGAIAIAFRLTTSGRIQHPLPNDSIHFVNTDISVVIDFVMANILSLYFPFFFSTIGMLQQRRSCQWPKVAKSDHTT